jgi:hypothetical protein
VYVQNVIGTSCEALGSGSGNFARSSSMILSAGASSAEATDTLRCELQSSTCRIAPSRSNNALSPASDDVRRRGSPSDSSELALVAQPSLRICFSPFSSARSTKAAETTPCRSTSCVSRSLGRQEPFNA